MGKRADGADAAADGRRGAGWTEIQPDSDVINPGSSTRVEHCLRYFPVGERPVRISGCARASTRQAREIRWQQQQQ